jgi:hypothetical protein
LRTIFGVGGRGRHVDQAVESSNLGKSKYEDEDENHEGARRSRTDESMAPQTPLKAKGTPKNPPCPPCEPSSSGVIDPSALFVFQRFLFFFFEVADPFVDVGIYRVVRLGKVAGSEEGPPNMLHVVVADRVCKNWQQVVDSEL